VIVVSNATPLIILAKVGYFDLLQKLFAEITISQEVWTEVVVKGAGRSGSAETAEASWIQVASLADPTQLPVWRSQFNLGAGEVFDNPPRKGVVG
jgi:predicted nucleic acid-binding protein